MLYDCFVFMHDCGPRANLMLPRGQRRASEIMNLKLWPVVAHSVGAGNLSPVLYKDKCSPLLSQSFSTAETYNQRTTGLPGKAGKNQVLGSVFASKCVSTEWLKP